MATDLHLPPQDEQVPPPPSIDYAVAEGLAEPPDEVRREWTLVGLGLTALIAVLAIFIAIAAFAITGDDDETPAPAATPAVAPAKPAADATAPTLADAKGVAFEKFAKVDPTLPAPVTKVDVDVFQHVTQVHKDLAPTEVWSYAVNGKYHRGTGVSAPIVVEQGTTVEFSITNGTEKAMKVDLPHSLDFHSAEVDPGRRYADLAPGKSMKYRFEAKHAGVFLYHCATQPVLMHTGAGMVGMMVVKPKGLPAVDRELWMTQQEYYLGKPGADADMAKMAAKKPDVIAFNGYANQYKDHPITVRRGEKIRMWVLNAGPSIWSSFHVIGTVFDKTVVEGTTGRSSQAINLAPAQGGYVEFTLDEEGTYPFVNHAFGDMVKGSLGVLKTENAPKAAGGHDMSGAAAKSQPAGKADANVTLGDMWVKSDVPSVKAGKVTFSVKNEGATIHGLALAKTPVNAEGGHIDHAALLFKGKDLAGGESETITADLKPGKYELVCHIAGHYMAGQKLAFTVS
jgi:uncharacterized cupredoxin-like copper-binding protein